MANLRDGTLASVLNTLKREVEKEQLSPETLEALAKVIAALKEISPLQSL